MKLVIEREAAAAMLRLAKAAAPLEACGLCGGREGRITSFHPLTNADASGEHFTMLPEEQFGAVRAMRAAGARMLAIWHSHPASPARMSDEDLRLAFTPETVYLITSLERPEEPVLRGFTVREGRPEPVEIEEQA